MVMRDFNLEFWDLYKSVDSFLKDAYSSDNGVTNYIQEMETQSYDGNRLVQNWDMDYDRLKHMRWIRNKFAHEASFDVEIAEQEDYDWLDSFYKRLFRCSIRGSIILNQLQMYHRRNSRHSITIIHILPKSQFSLNIEAFGRLSRTFFHEMTDFCIISALYQIFPASSSAV
jgi:hypothetical protein